METIKAVLEAISLMSYYPRWAQALFMTSFALVVASVVVFINLSSKAEEAKERTKPIGELSLTEGEESALGFVLTDPLAGTRGAWAYPLHQQLTYRGMSDAEATTTLSSLVAKGLLDAVDVPTYDDLEKRQTTAPAYRVTERGFSYAAKNAKLQGFDSQYRYILRLAGSQKKNGPFVEQLRSLDFVQAQTRFIIENDPRMSRVVVFSYKPLDESLVRNMAKAFKVSIESFARDK